MALIAVPEPKFRKSLAAMRSEYRRRKATQAAHRGRHVAPDLLPRRLLIPLILLILGGGTSAAALMTFGVPKSIGDRQLEVALRQVAAQQHLVPLRTPLSGDSEQVKLGKALFFDKLLSGNKDISCAGCHAPAFALTDAIPLSIGTGGHKLGPERTLGVGRDFIPRHAPDLFNRGDAAWTTMMWDARIVQEPDGRVRIPDVPEPIEGLDGALAGQVVHTVLNPAEMRGLPGDVTALDEHNELAVLQTPEEIWQGITARIMAVEGYARQMQRAYPDTLPEDIDIRHIANAIAAYERAALTFADTPWDRWLGGDEEALSVRQKQGALLFYGAAGCAQCHSGVLFTDQQVHNLAVPQLRPRAAGLDPGAGSFGGEQYAFRTPPLRQVTMTAPYMHSGAYAPLKQAIRHHADPEGMLRRYSPRALRDDVEALALRGPATENALLAAVAPELDEIPELTDEDLSLLVAFLGALTDPAASELKAVVPVLPSPSALTVDYDD